MLKLRQPLPCRQSLGYLVKVMLHFSFKSALLGNVFLPIVANLQGAGEKRGSCRASSEQKTQTLHDETPLGLLETGAGFMKK